MNNGLRVVIDARIDPGKVGGVETVLTGLANGMSQLDGPERLTFVVWEDAREWLLPYLSGRLSLAAQGRTHGRVATTASRLRRRVAPITPTPVRHWQRRRERRSWSTRLPAPDPFVEALEPNVVHMPIQNGFLTDTPAIYHPHDLQHLHLPAFFSKEELEWRGRWYPTLCAQAELVAVSSEWTREDVVKRLGISPDKVKVVPLAPPLAAGRMPDTAEQSALLEGLEIDPPYILYPAQFWAHKNHIRLLEAVARLRDSAGLTIQLVGTGFQTDYFSRVDAASRRLGLQQSVRWTGFVPPVALRALYARARAVVIPSLFESASGPLWEAFEAGVPAACSNVTSLPQQAGGAAVLFDPVDVGAIAAAIETVWSDGAARERLIHAGFAQIAALSWDRTARIFRAHYRRLGGVALSDEDRELIASP